MGVKGMLETCSRCEKTIFLKYIGTVERNGVCLEWDKYEVLPDDWLSQSGVGTLCPTCAKEFRRVMTNFYGRDKVPKAWETQESVIEGQVMKINIEVEAEKCPYWDYSKHEYTYCCNSCECVWTGNNLKNAQYGVMIGQDRYCLLGCDIRAEIVKTLNLA